MTLDGRIRSLKDDLPLSLDAASTNNKGQIIAQSTSDHAFFLTPAQFG